MKHYVLLWSILSSLMLLPAFNSDACYLRGYFFSPVGDTAPNLLSWAVLDEPNKPVFSFLEAPKENARKGNLAEWQDYFQGNVADSLLNEAIYEADKISLELSERFLDFKGGTAFINYMNYAKLCEPFMKQGVSAQKIQAEGRKLVKEGRKAYRQAKSDFLRLRYAYQVLRLERYFRDYEAVKKAFEEMIQPLWDEPSIIRYWAMEHLAGAYKGLGEQDRANCYFAQVFWHAPSRRTSSHRSIKMVDEGDWSAAMAFCETDTERAALHATRAYNPGGDKLAELEAIVALAPNGELTQTLAVDELQEVEGILLRSNNRGWYRMDYASGSNIYAATERAKRLQAVVEKLLAKETLAEAALWQSLQGYLLFLLGDTKNASIEFAQVLNREELKESVRQQVEVFAAAMEASQMPVIGEEQELRLMKLMPSLQDVEGRRGRRGDQNFLRAILYKKYLKQEEMAKSYLCHYDITPLLLNPRLDYINALLDFLGQPGELNALETFLLGEYSREEWINMLRELRATRLMREGYFSLAIELYKQLPKAFYEAEFTDYYPDAYQRFVAREKEFDLLRSVPELLQKELEDLPIYPKLRTPVNKREVAEVLLELETRYKNKPDDWRYAYLLMAAWKEMSYFGEAWRATDYFVRSSRLMGVNRFNRGEPNNGEPETLGAYALGNLDNYYHERIVSYATEAITEANQPEWEAALYFELGEYLQYLPEPDASQYMVRSFVQNSYRDTKYYQEVIRQCGFYAVE